MAILAFVLNACALGPGASEGPTPSAESATPDSGGTTAATSPSGGQDSGTPVTITFAVWPPDRPIYEPLIKSFQADNPGIAVQLVSIDSLIKPTLAPDGSANYDPNLSMRDIMTGADTVAFQPNDDAIAKGYVRDLTPLIEADATFDRADFYSGALEAYSRNGGIYMLPKSVQIDMIAYNKDLWAKSNLPTPSPDWRWDDVAAAAEQLAVKGDAAVTRYGLIDGSDGFKSLYSALTSAGVPSTVTETLRLDRPEAVAAMQRVSDLVKSGGIYIMPQSDGQTPPADPRELILSQHAAMWSPDIFSDIGAQPVNFPFEVGTAIFPSVPFGIDGYTMSAGTQHPQEAWRWLSFLSHQNVRSAFSGPAFKGVVPARKSIAEQTGYWTQLDDETSALVKAALERRSQLALVGLDSRAAQLLGEALRAVALGQKQPDKALAEIEAAVNARLAQTPAGTPEPIVVATPVPQTLPAGVTAVTFDTQGIASNDFQLLANEFNQKNTDLFVQVKTSSGPTPLADVAAQSDCFAGLGRLRSQDDIKAALKLQPLIDVDPEFPIKDYPAVLLEPFQQNDELFGLPYAVNFRVLNYNQTLFDAAKLDHPSASWTMAEFLNAAQQLTLGSGAQKQYGFASPPAAQVQDLFFFMEQNGAAPTKGSGDAEQPNFTDPKMSQAMRNYIDLLRNYSPHTYLQGYTRSDTRNIAFPLVAAGKVGMWFDFGSQFFGAPTGDSSGWTRAIAPPPLGDMAITSRDFFASGLYISAQNQQPEGCWRWFKFLSGQVVALQGGFPARRSVALSNEYTRQAPPGAVEVYEAYAAIFDRPSGAAAQASGPSQVNYYWLFRAVDRAIGGADLDRELADAQTLTEQYLLCVRNGGKAGTCATQVDPNYQG